MALSEKAQNILNRLNEANTKLGDLRIIAKEIKKDHDLALELWSAAKFLPMLLAILIMDNKKLNEDTVDKFLHDIENYPEKEQLQLADWLMANQLTKDKKLISLILSWQNSSSSLKRRIFWYYQGRLRWTGQIPPDNTEELFQAIEKNMATEEPEVQWAMNFTAGWIGVFDKPYREKCMELGEKLGLYKDEMVSKNCTPNYLPKFIEIEAGKRKL